MSRVSTLSRFLIDIELDHYKYGEMVKLSRQNGGYHASPYKVSEMCILAAKKKNFHHIINFFRCLCPFVEVSVMISFCRKILWALFKCALTNRLHFPS